MPKEITYIDLFAGAGGLSEGFIRKGFIPIAHVEMDEAACFTLRTRMAYHYLNAIGKKEEYVRYLKGGISREQFYSLVPSDVLAAVINSEISNKKNEAIFTKIKQLARGRVVDLIIGGPPCQAYSLVGRARDERGMADDPRNYLFRQYARYLEEFRPKYFVFENVVGLLSAKDQRERHYLDIMLELFRKAGYQTEYKVLNARDFGVLQDRKRVVLIGRRGRLGGYYPEFETLVDEILVGEIFTDLPEIEAGGGVLRDSLYREYKGTYLYDAGIRNGLPFTTLHSARPHTEQDKEIYRIAVQKWESHKERLDYNDLPARLKTHNNRTSFVDRFKVVAAHDKASHTVVAHIAKDGHHYIHPDIKQNRSLTPREAARLQSFPDDYYFESASGMPARTAAFRQIGNAVPPLMAEKIAGAMLRIF